MDIRNKNICFVCGFSAPYGGNFIRMLLSLSEVLVHEHSCDIFYIFPYQEDKQWLDEIKSAYTVGFISSDQSPINEFKKYFKQWGINLVHTNFEIYDIAVAKAIKFGGLDIAQVWHIHDYISIDKKGLSFSKIRKLITNYRLWQQYGVWGKDAYFISVSDEMAHLVNHYRKHRYRFPTKFSAEDFKHEKLISISSILNGIDMTRISDATSQIKSHTFRFLSFGGESYNKGIATIIDACKLLHSQNKKFVFILTGGYTTTNLLKDKFENMTPEWLKVIQQSDNVAEIFANSDCYISASRKETMSQAIAEASIYGLPVIQSDIPGTAWNTHNPSTFTFPVNDYVRLAECMSRVMEMSHKTEFKDSIKITIKNNSDNLSMSKWVNKIISVYRSI